MKKKVTILLLAFCLVFLAACGSPSPSDALKADLENAKSSPDEIMDGLGSDGFGEEATQALIDKVLEFDLSLIHISEPTRQAEISYAVFCLKKKKIRKQKTDS